MKLSFRTLFALSALAVMMGTLAFGCSKPAADPTPAPQTSSSVANPDGGAAAPPKTHD